MDNKRRLSADSRIGEILTYFEMCRNEGTSLQRGMNYRISNGNTVVLLSRRPGARYLDRFEEDGAVLIYEGHDVPRIMGGPEPKSVDQPMRTPNGRLTQNGKFYEAAKRASMGATPDLVRVYEKIHKGVWSFCGVFALLDAWLEISGKRKVFKFRLALSSDHAFEGSRSETGDLQHVRRIPSEVKVEVWRRDKGRCVECGSTDHLHFDHDIPFSLGGASITAANIQLLCARHNLKKRAQIK